MYDYYTGLISAGSAPGSGQNQGTLSHKSVLIDSHIQPARLLVAVEGRRNSWIA
jgi:hypothetical protein